MGKIPGFTVHSKFVNPGNFHSTQCGRPREGLSHDALVDAQLFIARMIYPEIYPTLCLECALSFRFIVIGYEQSRGVKVSLKDGK